MRIGIGQDAHCLTENRKLIIGGVYIPFEKGLSGHSDADVLIHAVMDALLGAMGKGDIGMLFPDNDNTYKDISSMILLKKVKKICDDMEMNVVNLDSVIVCQRPKLSSYFGEMRKNIAGVLDINENNVNIKATTTEKMGFTGREEGIEAKTVVLLDTKKDF